MDFDLPLQTRLTGDSILSTVCHFPIEVDTSVLRSGTPETPETTTSTTIPATNTDQLTDVVVDMKEAFYCEQSQAVASDLWKAAYPNFCPRCALSCDGQCGVCIHGRHLCACKICNPCATACA